MKYNPVVAPLWVIEVVQNWIEKTQTDMYVEEVIESIQLGFMQIVVGNCYETNIVENKEAITKYCERW